MDPIYEDQSASFKIKNPISYRKSTSLKFPSEIKSKSMNTFHKGDFSSVLSKTKKDGAIKNQTYNWTGFTIFIDMYQTYMYEKYRVQCRLDRRKLNDMYYNILNEPAPFSILIFANKNRNLRNMYKIIETQAESISNCLITHYDSKTSYFRSTTYATSSSTKKEKNKILPFSTVLALPEKKFHSNCIIFRKENNIVEIFEPHGTEFRDGTLRSIIDSQYKLLLDNVNQKLREKGSQMHFDIVYSNQTCPDMNGIQRIESTYAYRKGLKRDSEGGGYCALWSLFVQELALLNQDMSVKEIVEQVLRTKSNAQLGKLLLQVARGYSLFVSSKLSDYFTVVLGTQATVSNIKTIQKTDPQRFKDIMIYYHYYMLVQYDLYDMEMSMKELETYYSNEFMTQGSNTMIKTKLELLRKMMKIKAVTPLTRKKKFKKTRSITQRNKSMSMKIKEENDIVNKRTLQESDTYTMREGDTRCRKGYVRHPKGSRNCKAKTQKLTRRLFQNTEKPNIKTIDENMIYYKKEGQKRCPKGYNVDKKNKTRCLRKPA